MSGPPTSSHRTAHSNFSGRRGWAEIAVLLARDPLCKAQDRAFPPNSCRPVPALCLFELAPTAAKTVELPSTDRIQQGCGQPSPGFIIAKEENVAPVMVARLGQLPDDLPAVWRDNTVNDLKELKARL